MLVYQRVSTIHPQSLRQASMPVPARRLGTLGYCCWDVQIWESEEGRISNDTLVAPWLENPHLVRGFSMKMLVEFGGHDD